ncbi:unnamed protein product [Dovyalis caffra]|uniref:Uncharacterized protein n=1 Tax=Dovyalis caffra TaxID=77055 RepID=A0AAV1STF3_9ROSI|nr:unnamed protein product [Dovyalis caffra]
MECTMVADEARPRRSIECKLQVCRILLRPFAMGFELIAEMAPQRIVERLKAEMVEIVEQQNRNREGQKEIREKFNEIEFESDQLKRETFLIWQQAASNQQRLNLMLKILKAQGENNFHEASKLTQSLRTTTSSSRWVLLTNIDRAFTFRHSAGHAKYNRLNQRTLGLPNNVISYNPPEIFHCKVPDLFLTRKGN